VQEHYSVLLNESIKLLDIKPAGIYVDGTFGRGGHARKILELLDLHGRLIAFDKDPEAQGYAKTHFQDQRLTLIHDSFANIDLHLSELGINTVNGILLDLGVSSPQIDDEHRGFSFRFDSKLDMRMDNSKGQGAAEWINSVDEKSLADILWRYGEEKFSRRIAKKIVMTRCEKPIATTHELVDIIASCIPYKEKGQHPATRSFQAIRIYINNELEDLELMLAKIPQLLAVHGKIVVISFHSLEDRIVKKAFNELVEDQVLPKWVMASDVPKKYKIVAKKIRPCNKELMENSRSRSAILRCLEKL
jgi:16S rRNA (cytosine1402-N4)-methyltransferase